MIILKVTQTLKDGVKACDFYNALASSGAIEKSRKEPGCICYKCYYPAEEDGTLLLLEIWQDDSCLKAHQHSDHFAMLPAVKAPFVEATSIERFETV